MRLQVRLACALMFGVLACNITLCAPIEGPVEFKRDTVATYQVKPKGALDFEAPDGLTIVQRANEWFIAGKPGKYSVVVRDHWVDFDKKTSGLEKSTWTFTILPGEADPVPPPTPPGPGPGPNPPGPVVSTNPFGDTAARAMILVDPFPKTQMTLEQSTAITGEATRLALKGFAGDNVRTWPKGQTSKDAEWSTALQKIPTSYPCLMIGKGTQGLIVPITKAQDIADAVAKLSTATSAAPCPCTCGCGTTGVCTCGKGTPQPAAGVTPTATSWTVGGQTFQWAPPAAAACRIVGYDRRGQPIYSCLP